MPAMAAVHPNALLGYRRSCWIPMAVLARRRRPAFLDLRLLAVAVCSLCTLFVIQRQHHSIASEDVAAKGAAKRLGDSSSGGSGSRGGGSSSGAGRQAEEAAEGTTAAVDGQVSWAD